MSDIAKMLADAKEQGYKEGRADAFERCINAIISTESEVAKSTPFDVNLFAVMVDRQNEIIRLLERLKE